MSQAQNIVSSATSYELVAQEYYDRERHPTCANFRDASHILFRKWLNLFVTCEHICEVGAGKSLLAEILFEEHRSLKALVLVDESPSMLAYSEAWRQAGVAMDLASASTLPYGPESFDVVASCLGDPYNVIPFWSEVHRVLKDKGKCLFTTPSYEWARAFRATTDTNAMHSSEFELGDGSFVSLPSHIYQQCDQVRLIESGKLTVSEISHVSIQDLSEHKLSPKLVLRRGPEASIVTGYVASKD